MPNVSIFDILKPANIALYWQGLPQNQVNPFIGNSLFPPAYTPELSISFFQGRSKTKIALNPTTFDAEPPLRSRIGFKEVIEDIPFAREAYNVNEKLLSRLLRVERGDNSEAYARPVFREIFDDVVDLLDAGEILREAMRMQLLSAGGKISISGANGATYNIDYGLPAANKFAAAVPWSDTENADIIADLIAACDALYNESGSRAAFAMMNKNTWGNLIKNQKLKNGIQVLQGGISIQISGSAVTGIDYNVAPNAYGDFIRGAMNDGSTGSGNLQFIVNDKVYKPHQDSPNIPFFADGVVALLPTGTLGNTWYTDTPEALSMNPKFEVADVNNGIVVCRSENDKPPLGFELWASVLSLPSFEAITSYGYLSVA